MYKYRTIITIAVLLSFLAAAMPFTALAEDSAPPPADAPVEDADVLTEDAGVLTEDAEEPPPADAPAGDADVLAEEADVLTEDADVLTEDAEEPLPADAPVEDADVLAEDADVLTEDAEEPPPADAPAGEADVLAEDADVLTEDAEEPPPADAPAGDADVLIEEAEEPLPADAPVEDADVLIDDAEESPPADAPVVEESLTVPEILDAAPEDTQLVVLDENNQALPLVTEEAAEILLSGDPQWCPNGVAPGDAGCTPKFNSFTNLINELETNRVNYPGSGTVYIAHDYNAATAGDAGQDIVFDYNKMDLTDLVVQGGYDFNTNSVVGTSTIDLGAGAGALKFLDWGGFGLPGNLTLRDLTITNSEGLSIEDNADTTAADVTLENVNVGNTNAGAVVNTTGDIVVTGGSYSNNAGSGIRLYAGGSAAITDMIADGNNGFGALLQVDGDATLNGGSYSNNAMDGVNITNSGDVGLRDLAANENGGAGAWVNSTGGVSAFGGFYNNNATYGIGSEPGCPALNNVTTQNNGIQNVYPDGCGGGVNNAAKGNGEDETGSDDTDPCDMKALVAADVRVIELERVVKSLRLRAQAAWAAAESAKRMYQTARQEFKKLPEDSPELDTITKMINGLEIKWKEARAEYEKSEDEYGDMYDLLDRAKRTLKILKAACEEK